jgi:hypothetical protein
MILNASERANPWRPTPFGAFAAHYPETQWRAPGALERGAAFAACWHAHAGPALPRELAVVLTPGLFAEWLPTCFRGARRGFAADGHRVLQTPACTARGVRQQAAALAARLHAWLRPDERFLWCAHSKGGLDALFALDADENLRGRCAAIVLVQPPIGRSWLVDAWLAAPSGPRGALLRTRWFRDGVRDISSERDREVRDWLATHTPRVPALHAVSWSVRATSWVDSYHRELNRLRPGHAHDGQFYLADQLMPRWPVVGLAGIDHAQPVLGGAGLDTARLWRALAACVWQEAVQRT